MIEIDHQLDVRIVHRIHPCESLGGVVDDVALLLAQRFDRDGDVSRPRFRCDPFSKVDQLLKSLLPGESLGNLARPTAAKNNQAHAQARHSIERQADVFHLAVFIYVGPGDFDVGGDK